MSRPLEAQKSGSATARRQQMQEGHLQQYPGSRQRVLRKKVATSRMQTVAYPDDNSILPNTTYSDRDSVSTAPSKATVRTPETVLSMEDTSALDRRRENIPAVNTESRKETRESMKISLQTHNHPKMQATLTTIADWNYDRFSILIDPADLEEMLREDDEQTGDEPLPSSDEEELEEYSPIETATPISYTLPKTKPTVVSITTFQFQSPPLGSTTIIENRPTARRHVSEQISSASQQDVAKAPDSKLYHMSNSSHDTFATTTDSSQISRSVSLASQTNSTISRSFSQTSQSDQSEKSPKRKSSLPLLFGNNKNGHSRMSSIKKFIRSSTLGTPPANSAYGSLHRQASSATLETHFESRDSSIDIPTSPVDEPVRTSNPTGIITPSPTLIDVITALPSAQSPSVLVESDTPSPSLSPDPLSTKPVSKFRSRSGSFGRALRSNQSGPKTTDASAPPVPIISIPSPSLDLDRGSFPISPPLPPLTPRSMRRSVANYSPFPTAEKRTSSLNVGLGLRY